MSTPTPRIKTRVSDIWLESGIMRIEFYKGVELNLADMEEAYAHFREMGFGPGMKRSRQLLTGGPFYISKPARDYAGRNGHEYFIAASMVTKSIAMRFVINMFNAIQKHKVPFRVFATQEEALRWLLAFPEE